MPSVAGGPSRVAASVRWPLERALFALAGTVTLLAGTTSPWFLVLTAFVGVNRLMFVSLGACPASFPLGRVFGLRIQNLTPSRGISR